jgi:hypothetical protein
VARSSRAEGKAGGSSRKMRRDAELRGQNSEGYRDAVRSAACPRIAGRLPTVVELEAPAVALHRETAIPRRCGMTRIHRWLRRRFRAMPACTRKLRRVGRLWSTNPDRRTPTWWFQRPSEPSMRLRLRVLLRCFPDQFFVSERGRYFPDDSQDKGRLLSAAITASWASTAMMCR